MQFPRMSYAQASDLVSFSGSLVGDGEPSTQPVNNFYDVLCERDRMHCRLASIDQIDEDLMGGINVDDIPIRKWSDKLVVADSRDVAVQFQSCNWYEIRIDREGQQIEYGRYPNPAAFEDEDGICQLTQEEKVMRWRFGDKRESL